jgi:hypothetical protein
LFPAPNPTADIIQATGRELAYLHTKNVEFTETPVIPDDKHFDLISIHNNHLEPREWRHDRTKIIASLLEKCLVNISDNINVTLLICVHDKYDGEHSNYPIFSFGKCASKRPDIIQIPSLYLLDGTVRRRCKKTLKVDPPFQIKRGSVCFYGASTGDLNTDKNQRIQAALWAQDRKNMVIKITNWCQGADNHLKSKGFGKQIPKISKKSKSIRRQLWYKYLLNIDGNSTSWDRFIWQLYSNSLSLKLDSQQTEFWYPFLEDRQNYVSVNLDNIDNVVNYYNKNKKNAITINRQSKSLVKDWLLNPDFLNSYLSHLLIQLSDKFSN